MIYFVPRNQLKRSFGAMYVGVQMIALSALPQRARCVLSPVEPLPTGGVVGLGRVDGGDGICGMVCKIPEGGANRR